MSVARPVGWVLFLTIVLLFPGVAAAVPVQGPSGHYYEFVAGSIAWPAARTAALGLSHLGQPGYLATVTSDAENAFLLTLSSNAWLGGTDQDLEGTWRWADGPEASQIFWIGGPGGAPPLGAYAHWGTGQPDNGGVQNFLSIGDGNWDDFSGILGGFLVEFNNVPAPPTLGLVALGLIAFRVGRLFTSRRR